MSNKGDDEAGAKQQEQNLELRRSINNAYAFIEGQKLVQSFSAVTFEELMDQQIERIEGVSTTQKPNEIDRITKTENELIAAVANIKKMPDDAFNKTGTRFDPTTGKFESDGGASGVNTPP